MIKTYAVGDIHGCFGQLERLVEKCTKNAKNERAHFIFLGDYIDRGPDSRGVIEYLMAIQQSNPDGVTCLLGNHDQMLLSALDDAEHEEHWLLNGGVETLRSYGASDIAGIPKSHIGWLESLPAFYDDGLRFFTHAGIRPGTALDNQRKRDLLWIREPFLSSNADHGRFIVHGHTPVGNSHPDVRPNRINLDTGAVYGGPLTAAAFDAHQRMPTAILQAISDERAS